MAPTSLPAHLLLKDRQIVTRFQKRCIESHFPFLKLPAEIRCDIYVLCFEVDGIQKILGRYYERLRKAKHVKDVPGPHVYFRTPTVLCLSRQLFREALPLLQKHSITLDHGLLDLVNVTDFAKPALFCNVGSLTISDAGHKLLEEKTLATSFCGYMELIKQLANVLSTGHKLRNFTIEFSDPEMVVHMTACWNAHWSCGFRDSVIEAFRALRKVYGVKTVTLLGIPAALARELKAHMQSPAINFLDLPRELRDIIYGYSGDWSEVSAAISRTMTAWTDKNLPPPDPVCTTPTILLLNRQITNEAHEILRRKPLIITYPYDHGLTDHRQVPDMLRFIPGPTMQHVQHLVLKFESWEWVQSLKYFVPALVQSHSLLTLHIYFSDSLKHGYSANSRQKYPDSTLHSRLSLLSRVQGVGRVTFVGDLPACYTSPLALKMQMPRGGDGDDSLVPALMAMTSDGRVVPVDEVDFGDE